MERQEITEKVQSIMSDMLGNPVSELQPEHTLSDLGVDSLDEVELIMAFEEEFNIEIPDEDAEKIETIGDAIDYIAKCHPM